MKTQLPQAFIDKMKILLEEQYDSFLASYEDERVYGLRVNELKIQASQWQEQTEIKEHLTPIPWCPTGFYYTEQDRPGKHPHYHAGLYYIQEPSAMVPVELLDVRPGHRVLDLCAAPGGKSTQIASKLQGHGVLVSNDIATERTKPLVKNIELAGVRNAIVLNEHPANIAKVFTGWFDRILIDAPCSGEGMFRKNTAMIEEWEDFSVERCSMMQREILEEIALMLAPGGRMVYSTCTFSPEENEEQIARFLAAHPDFSVVPIEAQWGWGNGQPDWISAETQQQLTEQQLRSIAGTIRIWPHRSKGEGHFVAVLVRDGECYHPPISWNEEGETRIAWPTPALSTAAKSQQSKSRRNVGEGKGKKSAEVDYQAIWDTFTSEQVSLAGGEQLRAVMFGNRVSLQPYELPSLEGLKVIRAGWLVGEVKHGKFLPFHPLAMAIKRHEAKRTLSFSSNDELLIKYLKGETIFVEEHMLKRQGEVKLNGYVLILVDDYPVGFGKYDNGMIKNELPAGWRLI